MPAFDTIDEAVKALDKTKFILLRQNRRVIQDGALREHLIRLPRLTKITCPLQEILFRRAGIRW